MPDVLDLAQSYEELDRSAAIGNAVAASAPVYDGDCDDCGDPIPESRRRASPGARRCIDCQTEAERKP